MNITNAFHKDWPLTKVPGIIEVSSRDLVIPAFKTTDHQQMEYSVKKVQLLCSK